MKILHSNRFYLRCLSICLMLYLSLFFILSGIGNVTDVYPNWLAVHDVLSMKHLPVNAGASWRSIQSEVVQYIFYGAIVFVEFSIGILAFIGAIKLWLARSKEAEDFNKAKEVALLGIGLGISLYFFGYLCIGSQWFRMWMAPSGGAQSVSFQLTTFLCVLFLLIKNTN